MKNGVLKLSWVNIQSAVMSGIIMGILAIFAYIIGVGNIFTLNFHSLVNAGVLTALVTIVSLIQSVFTTNAGSTAGVQTVDSIVSVPATV